MTDFNPVVLPPRLYAALTPELHATGYFVALQPIPEPRTERYRDLVRCEGHDLQLREPVVPDWLEATMPKIASAPR